MCSKSNLIYSLYTECLMLNSLEQAIETHPMHSMFKSVLLQRDLGFISSTMERYVFNDKTKQNILIMTQSRVPTYQCALYSMHRWNDLCSNQHQLSSHPLLRLQSPASPNYKRTRSCVFLSTLIILLKIIVLIFITQLSTNVDVTGVALIKHFKVPLISVRN